MVQSCPTKRMWAILWYTTVHLALFRVVYLRRLEVQIVLVFIQVQKQSKNLHRTLSIVPWDLKQNGPHFAMHDRARRFQCSMFIRFLECHQGLDGCAAWERVDSPYALASSACIWREGVWKRSRIHSRTVETTLLSLHLREETLLLHLHWKKAKERSHEVHLRGGAS